MNQKVYIETTIVSYLTARQSRDLVIAAHCQITQEWWEQRGGNFDLYTSQIVIQEAKVGDTEMAKKRLEILETMPFLAVIQDAVDLAKTLFDKGPLPTKAAVDALHIAIATVHGMDYLLTWNCKHIANAEMQIAIAKKCRVAGYEPPIICTPEELLGS